MEEPSDYGITSGSVSSLEEYTEDWPSYSSGLGDLSEEPREYATPWSVTCENLEILDGMDLDDPAEVQLAVKTCLPSEPTVMVSTSLGALLSDFMIKLRNQLQIKMDQPLRVSFGCKTLKMEVTPAENGLKE